MSQRAHNYFHPTMEDLLRFAKDRDLVMYATSLQREITLLGDYHKKYVLASFNFKSHPGKASRIFIPFGDMKQRYSGDASAHLFVCSYMPKSALPDQTWFVLFARSHDIISHHLKTLVNLAADSITSNTATRKTFKWVSGSWESTPPRRCSQELFGVDAQNKKLAAVLDSYLQQRALRARLGADNGINVLVQGLPGTGKSSFVEHFARTHSLDTYYLTEINYAFQKQLNPIRVADPGKQGDLCAVVVDEFDKCSRDLSQISGAIYDSGNDDVIRFFIVNKTERLSSFFLSRMSLTLEFKHFSKPECKHFIASVFPEVDSDSVDGFMTEYTKGLASLKAVGKKVKVTPRDIVSYILRNITAEDPLAAMTQNFRPYIFQELQMSDSDVCLLM